MNNLVFLFTKDFSYLFPEIYLLVAILIFLLFGVFYTPKSVEVRSPYIILILTRISLLVFFILFLMVLLQYNNTNFIFASRFVISNFTVLIKLFLIIFLFLFFTMSLSYFIRDSIKSWKSVV